MNKYLFAAFIATAISAGASGAVRVTAIPVGERPMHNPMKANTYETADVVLRENFSNWTEGTEENPDFDNPVAGYEVQYIDSDLTEGKGLWSGSQVYSAGGACLLGSADPTVYAQITTPRGDYSGSVTVTFYAKSYKLDTDYSDGTSVNMGLYSDSGMQFEVKGTEGEYIAAHNLTPQLVIYPHFGWYKVTVEFDNYTACNDAALSFFSAQGLLLDDIEVTTSGDKFIAAPVMDGVTDVTETSFTVNFQPVRKAANFYTYLFELRGYDEESGEPIYMPVPDPELYNGLVEDLGEEISYEEYWQLYEGIEDLDSQWYREYPYCNYGRVQYSENPSFTFSGLDPEKQYYYAVRSRYMFTFSPLDIVPMTQIATPEVEEAIDITENSFTAQWSPIVKADSYAVNLYGVNRVNEDTEDFIIFEEDFERVSEWTEAEDIYYPDVLDPEGGINMDDLTSTPGWDAPLEHIRLVNGILGFDGQPNWWSTPWLSTPDLYVAGSDKITVSLRALFLEDNSEFLIEFAGVNYTGGTTSDVFEKQFELPTNGYDVAKLRFSGTIFIDYIEISQNLSEGDFTYTYMGSAETEKPQYVFTGIDVDRFDMYAYSAVAIKGEGESAIFSQPSERMIVNLKTGESFTGLTSVDMAASGDVVETERYTIDGRRIEAPVKGLNIIRMSDGSVRKIMVR